MIAIDGLNDNQQKAVLWGEGPMLVLAGPGSGKTRVLTFRVARLLEEDDSASVLALTFTNKAADEMRERLNDLVGNAGGRSHLCTFHAFAADVLRQHGNHLGIKPGFMLISMEEDRLAVLRPLAAAARHEHRGVPTSDKDVLGLIDKLFAGGYAGAGPTRLGVTSDAWLPQLFLTYCDTLVNEGRQDFGSLLHFTRRLLERLPAIQRAVRTAWDYVCVDEFQDTNGAQYDLLRLIVPEKNPNLFIVGDDDQIIYQWNGASPERIETLTRDYAPALIQLPENYRCPPEIIELANRLIAYNHYRKAQKAPLTARRTSSMNDDVIRNFSCATPAQEAEGLARDILKRRLSPKDVAVLGRTARVVEPFVGALRAAGIEAHWVRRKDEFDSGPLRVFFATLRLANARHDEELLRRACLAWEALSSCTLKVQEVSAAANLIGGDFLRAWAQAARRTQPEGTAHALLSKIEFSLVERLEFPGIMTWFLSENWTANPSESAGDIQQELETLTALHESLCREYGEENLTLNGYLQSMALMSKSPEPGPGAVNCMTVHGCKGLEFKHVYVVGMAQEVFPSYHALKAGPGSHELEEERRSCFVAITRVRETVTFSHAIEYQGWSKQPSQFLREMGLVVDVD